MCNESARRYTSDLKIDILPAGMSEPRPARDFGQGDEAELIAQIAAVPPGAAAEAEAELYHRMAPRVRLFGLRHLRDEHAAADLAQEVMLIVFEAARAGRLREPEKLVSFVLGTCRMTVLNIRRNASRREELLNRYQGDLPESTYSPEPVLDRAQLGRCLDALPERERSVVVMSFYDERSSKEVASLLAVSEANVRVIRHRALGHLRDCMEGRKGTQ